MTHKFYIPLGMNQDANEQDVSLDFIRYTSGLAARRLITDDPFVQAACGIPQLWDGWLFTDILRSNKELVAFLEQMQYDKWVQSGGKRKILIHKIVQIFKQHYIELYTVKCIKETREFFEQWPNYTGMLVCFGIGCERLSVHAHDVINIPADPFTLSQKQRILSAIEKCSPLIADWCMANFSSFRESWCFSRDAVPVSLENYSNIEVDSDDDFELTEDDILYDAELAKHVTHNKKPLRKRIEKIKKKILAATALADMSPEEKRNHLISKKLESKIRALRRQGKIPDGVRETLYWDQE